VPEVQPGLVIRRFQLVSSRKKPQFDLARRAFRGTKSHILWANIYQSIAEAQLALRVRN